MHSLSATTRATLPLTLCASSHCKLIGTTDGTFPDFGHHSEREMGGLWMQPIKLLDGFWLRLHDLDADNVNTWVLAEECEQTPTGNHFRYLNGLGHTPVTIDRSQLAPEEMPGLLLGYRFHNRSDTPRHIEVEWRLRTDLCPCWYTLDTGTCTYGTDVGTWDEATATFAAHDTDNPWWVLVQCVQPPKTAAHGALWTPQGSGNGTAAAFTWQVILAPQETYRLDFRITGSAVSRAEAEDRLRLLQQGGDFLPRKQAYVDHLLGYSVLASGSAALDSVWPWVKAHTDWLTIDAGPYGRGLAAGLPEYPWWFGCDSCYAIQGLLCTGRFQLARDTLCLLARYSEQVNGNGRIVHEITPFGLCPNPGNTQETAHFVTAVWHYWQWTGDLSLVEELLPLLRRSMQWLTAQDEDGDCLPSGYGIIEIRGLNAEMIDTAAYTSQAWGCFARLLAATGAPSAEISAAEAAHQAVRTALNTILWDESAGSYCDACADPAFVRKKRAEILAWRTTPADPTEEAAFEAQLAAKERQGGEAGFLINRNWTIATPLESGESDTDKAARALEALWSPALIGPWGVCLNAYDERMMTISTGCFAVALARWGQPDRALQLLERLCATFGKGGPGMLSEMSPDYGCAVQGWTAYALFVPVVRHFFGLQPKAWEAVQISPCMPSTWREASLTHVRLPGGHVDIHWRRTDAGEVLTLQADHELQVEIRGQVHCLTRGETHSFHI